MSLPPDVSQAMTPTMTSPLHYHRGDVEGEMWREGCRGREGQGGRAREEVRVERGKENKGRKRMGE